MASKVAPSENVAVTRDKPDTISVSGELTFATAQKALADVRAAVGQANTTTLDLGGVGRADSAGLACVLAILSEAPGLAVARMPDGMRALARVSDVEPMLAGSR
ncbi:MAG TPA: STAS domain-containing protein [Pinirhizobacter sp.]|uniref:STAS domain-containing protein n=1 Tax=Pinirhizobacter sp. TaxID=2950432 RepID=UPI002C413279|nr:STAS domain-containing protein [Pinirhizobacter sp.]HMH68878.1 STAS domain-containing protein [Pinirhizobacter sp.]